MLLFLNFQKMETVLLLMPGQQGEDSVSYMAKEHHRIFCSYCCQLKGKDNLRCYITKRNTQKDITQQKFITEKFFSAMIFLFPVQAQPSVHEMLRCTARVGFGDALGIRTSSPDER